MLNNVPNRTLHDSDCVIAGGQLLPDQKWMKVRYEPGGNFISELKLISRFVGSLFLAAVPRAESDRE
jgi:hypothetical protein